MAIMPKYLTFFHSDLQLSYDYDYVFGYVSLDMQSGHAMNYETRVKSECQKNAQRTAEIEGHLNIWIGCTRCCNAIETTIILRH